MTLVLRAWLARFLPAVAPVAGPTLADPAPPLNIEIERLPDYLWRDLGFPMPARPDQDR